MTITDPFERPQTIETPDDRPVARVLRAFKVVEPALVATPITMRSGVQGAIVGPSCIRCGTRVWLSPSSQRHGEAWKSVVCFPCIRGALLPSEREAVDREWADEADRVLGPFLDPKNARG